MKTKKNCKSSNKLSQGLTKVLLLTTTLLITGCGEKKLNFEDAAVKEVVSSCDMQVTSVPVKDDLAPVQKAKLRNDELKRCLKEKGYDFTEDLKFITEKGYKKEYKQQYDSILRPYLQSINENPQLTINNFEEVYSKDELTNIQKIQNIMDQSGEIIPSVNLMKKVEIYKTADNNKDFITMASLVLPSVLKEYGGTEAFVNSMKLDEVTLKEKGFKYDKLKINKIDKLNSFKSNMFTTIKTETPVINTENTKLNGTYKTDLIAYSEDKGNSWYILIGSDKARMIIADNNPEIIQKLSIQEPSIEIGYGENKKTVISKNGDWIELENKLAEIKEQAQITSVITASRKYSEKQDTNQTRVQSLSTNNSTNDSSFNEDEIKETINRWQTIKASTKKNLNTEGYESILTGKALKDNTNGINWLTNNNSFWNLETNSININSIEKIDDFNAKAIVDISEKGDYYHDGKLSNKLSYNKSYTALYKLEYTNSAWLINEMDVIKK